VIEPRHEPTATTTLAPPDGVDVVSTRTRLLTEQGIVTSAIGPERAPGEMTGPVLRVSPHLDATIDDFEALAAAL
jgi:pyridoxal 5-phosphate dependent beta-lyase